MAASIRSLVNGINPIVGLSRADLRPSDIITLEAADLSNTTYAWNIAYKPEGSAAAIVGDPTTSGPLTFTVDREGPYLIRLITDLGLPTQSEQHVRLRYLTLLGDLALVAGGEQNNSPVPVPVDSSPQGWADDQNRNILTLLGLLQSVVSSGRILYVDANATGGTGIVDPVTGLVEGYGDHSLVQAGIDQAAAVATALAPWIVAVRPGSYQEDVTFKPFVYVVGWPGNDTGEQNGNAVVIRSLATSHVISTPVPGDAVVLSNLTLENSVSTAATLAKTGPGIAIIYRCALTQLGTTPTQGGAFSLADGSAVLDNCTVQLAAAAPADRAAFTQDGSGTVATIRNTRIVGPSGMRLNSTEIAGSGIACEVRDSRIVSSGGAGAAALFTDADDLLLEYSRIESAVAAPIVAHPSAAAFAGPVGLTLRWCFVGGLIRFDTSGPLAASTLNLGSVEYTTLDFPGGVPGTLAATTKSTSLFYDNSLTAPDITSSDVQGAIDDLHAYAALVRTLDDAYDGGIPNSGTGKIIVADQGAVDIVDAPAPSNPPPPGNTDGMLRVVGGVEVGSLTVPEIKLDPNPYGSGPVITMGQAVVANNAPVLAGDAYLLGNATGDPLFRNYNLRVGTKSSEGGIAIGTLVLRGGDALSNGAVTPDAASVFIEAGSGFDAAAGDAGDVWIAPGDSDFGPVGSLFLARPEDATAATLTAAGVFVGGVTGNVSIATDMGAITVAIDAADNLAAVQAKFNATGQVTAVGDPIVLTSSAKGPNAQVFFLNADAGVDAALGVFDGQVQVGGTYPTFIRIRVIGSNTIEFGLDGAGGASPGPMIYDADEGKLTVPGIIDPTHLVLDQVPPTAYTLSKGTLYVGDGTGGSSLGDLYYVHEFGAPSSVPINLSGAAVSGTISVEDEGISVDPVATTLNFIGASVTATPAGGNQVDITIAGGGGGLIAGVTQDVIPAASFAVAAPGSTFTVSATPDATAAIAGLRIMFRNGVADMTETVGVPATIDQWRLNGTTLEIGADITVTTDTYRLVYPNT